MSDVAKKRLLTNREIVQFAKHVKKFRSDGTYKHNFGTYWAPDVNPEHVRYQWLPSQFDLIKNSSNKVVDVKIRSYINNLDPVVHKPLYNMIEKIFLQFVPLLKTQLGFI